MLAGSLAAVLLGGCHERPQERKASGSSVPASRPPAAAPTATETKLRVPRIAAAPKLDGELTDDAWHADVRTHAFVDAGGQEARPFSEAHFLADAGTLYLGLYAADQDIEPSDAFHLSIRDPGDAAVSYALDISATGAVTGTRAQQPWKSGLELAIDRDGTPGDARDEDEEWVVEAALPLAAIGAGSANAIALTVSRCDTPKGGARACGSWGAGPGGAIAGVLELEPKK